MPQLRIQQIQGPGLFSPCDGRVVTTRGVVIGASRKGYFIQDPDPDPDPAAHGDADGAASRGLFVFTRRRKPATGSLVEVTGRVTDYLPDEHDRPTTQLIEASHSVLADRGPQIEPVWFTAERVLRPPAELAVWLNGLEGMLVGIPAGSTFVAPSNPFGDYVLLPPGADLPRTAHDGVLVSADRPERWLPGFRALDYADAPSVNVGAGLLEPVVGPLNFRSASYQIAADGPVKAGPASVTRRATRLRSDATHLTVLTLNGFNLDVRKEDPGRVNDPGRDVDDDLGDGRFAALGQAIVDAAACPALVALQEIQDNDGAEISPEVAADRTYAALIAAVQRAGGPTYAWAGLPPESGADGGQPGGNIRNGFLYDPDRVQLVEGSLQRLGIDAPAFVDSRKPLVARFRMATGRGELELINVHLASKRHQLGLFAPRNPGVDPRLAMRIQQARIIGQHLGQLRDQAVDYYVTGDFNDFEFSATLSTLVGEHSIDLVDAVPAPRRYDYNHRGLCAALMHGVVAKRQLAGRTAEYDILHANVLEGAVPGRTGTKASDHAYVVARLELAG